MRRTRSAAIIVLKCAVIGLGASAQQAAFSMDMALPSKPAVKVIEELTGSNVTLQSPGARSPEIGHVPMSPLIMSQPELVASASQTGSGNIPETKETKNTDMPTESQATTQETKNANAPTEPQAVMREIKSATRLSSSKQRRRKPKMAGVPAGSQTLAQETKEPESQVGVGETKEPKAQAMVKKTKESELPSAVQENEEASTPDESLAVAQGTEKTATPVAPGAEVKELKAEGPKKKRYAMAPVRWGGTLTETIGVGRVKVINHSIAPANVTADLKNVSYASSLVNTQTASFGARSYFLQPYIAKMDGNIGVVSSKAGSTNTTSLPSTIDIRSSTSTRNNTLHGRGNLSMFAQSRFPFKMSLGVSNNRDSTGFQTTDTVYKNLLLQQSYKPLASVSKYDGSYVRDTNTSFNNTSTHSYWDGNYSTYNTEHRIRATTRLNERNTTLTSNMRTDDFTLSDTYLPADSLWSFDSFGNLNLFTDNNGNNTRYLLAQTGITWQPEDEEIPLFVNGNVHLFDQLSTSQGIAAKSQSLGATAAARYLFSNILIGRASGDVTSVGSNGTRSLATRQQGAIAYSPPSVRLWENSSYSWNASGGASNSTNSAGGDSNIFGNAGQSLQVPYSFSVRGKSLRIGSGINQSLTVNASRIGGQTITLNNSAGMSFGAPVASIPSKELLGGYGKLTGGMGAGGSLTVSDSRTYGRNPSSNRTVLLRVNLQESGKTVYARSGLVVEGGVESIQGTGGGWTQLVGVGSATYSYRKSRVFNVRGLDYTGSASASRRTSNSSMDVNNANSVNVNNPSFPWKIDQGLSYRVGQNELRLTGSIADSSGVKNASLWLLFRAWRTIGN